MASLRSHSGTQLLLNDSMPRSQRHMRSGTPDVTPSWEADHMPDDHYRVRLVDLARNSAEDLHHLATPPPPAVPSRSALGSRLLSTLSNAQPAAAALTRKGSVLHSRAQSLAAFAPKLNPSNNVSSDKPANRLFGDLFHGQSAPIRLGAPISPTKEKEESEIVMDYISTFTERPGFLRRRETAPQQQSTSIVSTPKSQSSWFNRKTTNPIVNKKPQDELAALNIQSALFPNGPADPMDPAAFNNLLLNATNLLQRMQTAYREKTDYIASIRPEQEAQQDEVEEAETRATHLKKQLEDMSRRAQEQETTMKEMARELAEEKMRTLELQEAAANTVRLVSNSTTSEDANGSMRRRKRPSTSNASDSGFESDMDSVSIFSGYSGAAPDTPLSPPPISRMASFESRNTNGREACPPNPPRIITKMAGNNGVTQRLGREGAAWATVDALRGENQELKHLLEEMREELQGCIEFVSLVDGS